MIFTLIVVFLTAGFLFERILEWLNISRWKNVMPEEAAPIYTPENYLYASNYAKANYRYSVFSSIFNFVIIILALITGIFGQLDTVLRYFIYSPGLTAVAFFGILLVASDVLNLPFTLYKNFVIEERFGFNRMSLKTFFLDKLKGYLLAAVIGGLLVIILVKILQLTGHNFWWIAWIILTIFMLFTTMFYASWIVPLFNKLTPLPDGDLRSEIQKYSAKNDFPLDDLFIMDGSKRSAKANAFFSGLGKRKRIVLFDTLVEKHSTDELVAVLAHEIGHFKLKHTRQGLLLGILQTGLMLFIFSLVQGNPELAMALDASENSLHLDLLAFGLLYSPVSTMLGVVMNIFSRKNEFEADAFARKTANAEALSSALLKLSTDNLSNPLPHPAYIFIHYSHPPVLQRLKKLKE